MKRFKGTPGPWELRSEWDFAREIIAKALGKGENNEVQR